MILNLGWRMVYLFFKKRLFKFAWLKNAQIYAPAHLFKALRFVYLLTALRRWLTDKVNSVSISALTAGF